MAEQDEEKNLDLASQLVETYKKANVELMERVSIIKNSYSEAAKEHALIKQVQQETEKAIKSKKLLVLLEEEIAEGTVKSADIEKEREKLLDRIKNLTIDKSLAEKAANAAQKDGLKEQSELYQDIVKEIEDSIDKLEKMEGAAKGVEDQAKKLEEKSGTSFFTQLDEAFGSEGKGKASGFFQTLGEGFADAAKEAKKIGFEQDQAKAAGVERKKIDFDKRMGADAKDPAKRGRFRDKTSGKLVGGDKVKALDSKIAKGGGGLVKRMGGAIKALIAKIGPMLKKMLGPVAIILEVVEAIGRVDSELVEMSKSLQMSKGEAQQLRGAMSVSATQSNDLFVTTTKMIKAQSTLNSELGLSAVFSGDILVKATQLLEKVKLTGAATAGLAGQTIVAGGSMKDNYENALATSYEMQRGVGIALDNRKVLEAVGKTTGIIRAQMGGNTEEITRAVTQAKLLGMELKDVAASGKQILDFESSIQAELEAELLTGKQLNLEKARLAALTGDYETLTNEIAKNAGSFTEFTGMNVLQQEALAKSLGMQADQMADMLYKQETQNKTARELRAMGKEDLADRLEATTAQDKFNAAMDKLKGILADLVTPLIPLLDLIMSVVNPILQLLTFLDPIVKAATFLVTSLIDGLSWLTSFGTREDGATKASFNDLGASFINSGKMMGIGEGNTGVSEASGYAYADEGIAKTPQIASLAEKKPEVVMNADRLNGMDNTETNALLQKLVAGQSNQPSMVVKQYKRPYSDANYYDGPAGREQSLTGIYS
tara:strand:+ start:1373 stop:3685 length:2313 start_codon:yes stop_codon:yes gene_type:complete